MQSFLNLPMGALLRLVAHVDARWFQIVFLLALLLFGVLQREFALTHTQILLTLSFALLTQTVWQWGLKLPSRHSWGGYLSAIITSLGMCILVRAENLWAHPLLACLAMSSKYVLRAGQPPTRSHFLNPANCAAMLALYALPGTWLSPGQWGSERLAALWFVALGGLVTQRVKRWDVSLSFLAAWGGLLALRLWWLDYRLDPGIAMWLQQMSNGSVLLFAFFMISDPMTTPQHAKARLAYAVCVAVGALLWQFVLFKPSGLIVALFVLSWTVPLWNARWPQPRFAWSHA